MRGASLATTLVLAIPTMAIAVCNVIPGPHVSFRGVAGMIDRPFAGPGEWVRIALRSDCDARSFAVPARDNVVSIIFTPTSSAPANMVVLSSDCGSLEPERRRCEGLSELDRVVCVPVPAAEASDPVPGDPRIAFQLTSAGLRFRFPDTDAILAPSDDNLTLAGSAAIAVTTTNDPLPCGVARHGCAGEPGVVACVDALSNDDGECLGPPDTVFPHFTALPPPNDFQAMCDPFGNQVCTGEVDEIRAVTDTDGNLLVPMDWLGVLSSDGALPIARTVRATGAVEAFPNGDGPPGVVRVPDASFLASFSPEGVRVAARFDPQADPANPSPLAIFGTADASAGVVRIARRQLATVCVGGASAGRPCRSEADCDGDSGCGPVRRYLACIGGARDRLPCTLPGQCPDGTCGATTCIGGEATLNVCADDSDCPGGECGLGLFEFRGGAHEGVGPIVIRRRACRGGSRNGQVCATDGACPSGSCVRVYETEAIDPVALDGWAQSDTLNVFVVPERAQRLDLNGDGDARDEVIEVGARSSGTMQRIGVSANGETAIGRALVRLRRPPFTLPAFVVHGDLLAFLESEPGQGRDANGNGRLFESILRVFELGGASLLPENDARAVDPSPRIDGSGLSFSSDPARGSAAPILLYRRPEAVGARQRTERVSLNDEGHEFRVPSYVLGISDDDKVVLFATCTESGDGNLYVRDLRMVPPRTIAIAIDVGCFGRAILSADGMTVAFVTSATLVPGDTDTNLDVYLTRVGSGTYTRLSPAGGGKYAFDMSSDGCHIAFQCPFGTFSESGICIYDCGQPSTISRLPGLRTFDDGTTVFADGFRGVSISADGSRVTFPDSKQGLWMFERQSGVLTRLDVSTLGEPGNEASEDIGPLSRDGRFAVLSSGASNLVAGDTNDGDDIFVRDLQAGVTTRVSVGSDGSQANGPSFAPRISSDGRYVGFESGASNLVSPSAGRCPPDCVGTFVHDRLTGMTMRTDAGLISNDWRSVVFSSNDSTLVADDFNGTSDAFLRGPDSSDSSDDFFPDGELDDTVLEVLNTGTGKTTRLCPAEDVTVADGKAAFLRPESAGDSLAPSGCPSGLTHVGGKPDLNQDGDAEDEVVHLWRGSGPVENLKEAATAISMSGQYLAAITADRGADGAGPVKVIPLATGATWVPAGERATRIQVCGSSVVAMTSPGPAPTDSSGTASFLSVYDAERNVLIATGQTAVEFVCSRSLVAFRTREATQGISLDDDDDRNDDVLQVYDIGRPECLTHGHPADCLLNSRQTVVTCSFEACDPRVPYRVLNDTVRFLSLECGQGTAQTSGTCSGGGTDLSGDGDVDDLVVQILNVHQATSANGATARQHPVASAASGLCLEDGRSCLVNGDCKPGTPCVVPPGGCTRDTGVPCGVSSPCPAAGQFCHPLPGGAGTCMEVGGPCASDAECQNGYVCGKDTLGTLASPLVQQDGGTVVFTGSGRCIESLPARCVAGTDCGRGEFCAGGTCRREHGSCRGNSDCPLQSHCEPNLITATARDSDGDEVPDAIDNCPDVRNADQTDTDGNGIGDACQPCGSRRAGCDDGNPCTRDHCSQGTCLHQAALDGTFCNDGNACTLGDMCQAGACLSAQSVVCEGGGDSCGRTQRCEPATGRCRPTGPTACDDQDPCTTDSCNAQTGCTHERRRDVDALGCWFPLVASESCRGGFVPRKLLRAVIRVNHHVGRALQKGRPRARQRELRVVRRELERLLPLVERLRNRPRRRISADCANNLRSALTDSLDVVSGALRSLGAH